MKKSEMLQRILAKVSEVCEVSPDAVLGGTKLQAVVDARVLVVQYCRRVGLSNDDIALVVLRSGSSEPSLDAVKRKAKVVDKLFRGYSCRCLQSYAFCLMSADISAWCREQYDALYCAGMKPAPHK